MAGKQVRYSEEERARYLSELKQSGLDVQVFAEGCGISCATLWRWMRESGSKKKSKKSKRSPSHQGPYSSEQRIQTVETFLQSGLTQADFAKTLGMPPKTFYKWIEAYRKKGNAGLVATSFKENAKKRGIKGISKFLKEQIAEVKINNPTFGIRKVRDFLKRFGGVQVSAGTINKTLKEEKLDDLPVKKKRRRAPDVVRRFERATAMQLWQSDITSFILPRNSQRCYLTVFLDDYSRYVVSWSLELRQTSDFVMRTLLSGIEKFGKPEEVLTDQGRQYFSWRGKSEFQHMLHKQGIKHVVSRSHHPETLGKCERLWETIQKELWERVGPLDLDEAKERVGNFINHYNHFRTHQGLDGMIPADRFFGVESEVRKVLEKSFADNELRMALGERPRNPVFLIGQIGDRPISLHGESGKLVVQMPDGERQHLNYEEFGHGKGRSEESGRQGETEKEKIGATEESSNPGQGTMGNGERGTKGASADGGDGTTRILDGKNQQNGNSEKIERSTVENLADVPAGDFGYASRATQATQTLEQRDEHDGGRRSEGAQEENSGAGSTGGEAKHPDRDHEDDARVSQCSSSRGTGQGGPEE